METILNVINFFTPEQWAVGGSVIATALGGWGIIALIKARHLRKKGEKLWAGWVNLNVAFWPLLLSFVGAALANLEQMTSVLSLIPVSSSYALNYGPKASIILVTVHTVATAVSKFWLSQRKDKPVVEVQPETVTSTSQSFGTASAGIEPPASQLWR